MSTYIPLVSLAAAMLLLSCKKESSGNTTVPGNSDETAFPVTFDAGGFTQELDSFGRKTSDAASLAKDSLDGHVKYLYYKVYGTGAQAAIKRVIVQEAGTASFGIIRDTLPPGNYKFTLLATGDEYLSHVTNAGFKYPGSDAFSTHFEMVVNGPANAKVSLDRIVARLQFIIQDPLPADAAWMDIRFGGIPRVFNFPTGEVSNPANGTAYSNYTGYRFQIPAYNQGKPGFKTQAYFPLQGSYTVPSITVMCWGNNGTLLASKVIKDVKFETGKRTVLKGNLFPPAGSGIEVDLNDTNWKPDSIAVFY
ncbi:hypothetical protein [Chitinophaga sp.]|uniref:hypothetical protein n=1 Tax=Chitinophaga sp. TaxID=1869181 RepID=UPI002F92EDC5